MKTIDQSIFKTGQAFSVCNGNASFFAREIQKSQELKYPWNVAKFHHEGMIKIKDGKVLVEEEKRLIHSVGETPIEEYLKSDSSTYMLREPVCGLPDDLQNILFILMERDNNTGVYNIPGVFNMLYKFAAYKITKQNRWLNVCNSRNMEVCSQKVEEWYKAALKMLNNPLYLRLMQELIDDDFTMAPADFVVSNCFKTVAIF
jgi:hypothetical protein